MRTTILLILCENVWRFTGAQAGACRTALLRIPIGDLFARYQWIPNKYLHFQKRKRLVDICTTADRFIGDSGAEMWYDCFDAILLVVCGARHFACKALRALTTSLHETWL